MEKLLPCPFCGEMAIINKKDAAFVIMCPKCITIQIISVEKETAIKVWNTRSCYPTEFVEWITTRYVYTKDGYLSTKERNNPIKFYTIEEIYKLWKEKKKNIG